MKPNYSKLEFDSASSDDFLSCYCYNCNNVFKTRKKFIVRSLKYNLNVVKCCSFKCSREFLIRKHELICTNCEILFKRIQSEINRSKSGNHFCSKSCAATYNNTHKTTGNRRSKLEKYLENELTKIYSTLEIHFNRKDAISSELDIYIPSLKLAFELNGVFHYEPIFGQNKLDQIQNNDDRKFQACLEREIELCIIDSSKYDYFKEQTANKFLNIIITIINNKSKNTSNI